ncbi:MAG: hypothetical protein R3A78_12685 [Polyangiales bacterium]
MGRARRTRRSPTIHAAAAIAGACLCLGTPAAALAHFGEDFEAATTTTAAQGACWRFRGAGVSSIGAIEGNHGVRTQPLASGLVRSVGGPWVSLDGFGALSFEHRVDNAAGTPTLRLVRIDRAGAATVLATYSHTNTSVQSESVPLAYQGVYRFEFWFEGATDTARGYLDDVFFPAAPFADTTANPGNGACPPFECMTSFDCLDREDAPYCSPLTNRCVACNFANDCPGDDPCLAYDCVANTCVTEPICTVDGGADGGDAGPADGGAFRDGGDDAGHQTDRADSGSKFDGGDGANDASTRDGSSARILAGGGGCAIAARAQLPPRNPLPHNPWWLAVPCVALAMLRRARRHDDLR